MCGVDGHDDWYLFAKHALEVVLEEIGWVEACNKRKGFRGRARAGDELVFVAENVEITPCSFQPLIRR